MTLLVGHHRHWRTIVVLILSLYVFIRLMTVNDWLPLELWSQVVQ